MRKKLRPSGGYRRTASFQTATIIYDGTYWFCEKFLDPRGRMADQMVQAARSGRQNIAEGSRASATSSQTELRLLNVARSSLEELLLDHQIASVEGQFIEEGGYSEQLASARLEERERKRKYQSDPADLSDPSNRIPSCPQCGKLMVIRTARNGKSAGSQFWGCSSYPQCKGVVES
ncbi:MAG: hypothetical protein A2X48_04895 [Lentisphaerae bacterium GWF2_49_21]|nr:MAG: hypothetical protein A2X48_04895 [Lentisphaerae bacterium GWF2_49_21]